MLVKEIMTAPVRTVSEDTVLSDVARLMLESGIGCVPVLDTSGNLSGLITKSDFIAEEKSIPFSTVHLPQLFGTWLREGAEKIYRAVRTMQAREVMTNSPITLKENDLVKTFLEKIISHNISHAPVMRGSEMVGIVARHDLLKMMVDPDDASPKPV